MLWEQVKGDERLRVLASKATRHLSPSLSSLHFVWLQFLGDGRRAGQVGQAEEATDDATRPYTPLCRGNSAWKKIAKVPDVSRVRIDQFLSYCK